LQIGGVLQNGFLRLEAHKLRGGRIGVAELGQVAFGAAGNVGQDSNQWNQGESSQDALVQDALIQSRYIAGVPVNLVCGIGSIPPGEGGGCGRFLARLSQPMVMGCSRPADNRAAQVYDERLFRMHDRAVQVSCGFLTAACPPNHDLELEWVEMDVVSEYLT
jgi:hypothetical protein